MYYVIKERETEINHDLVNLFVQWMSEGGKGQNRDMIYLPNLFRKYQASGVAVNDLELDSF